MDWSAILIALFGSGIGAAVIDFIRERRRAADGIPDQWRKLTEDLRADITRERLYREEDIARLVREGDRREADLLLQLGHLTEKLSAAEKAYADLDYRFDRLSNENARLQAEAMRLESENVGLKDRVRKLEAIITKHGLDTGPLGELPAAP